MSLIPNPTIASPLGAPPAAGRKNAVPRVDPQTEDELLSQVDAENGGFLSDLFWYLDTPGAMTRAALAGQNPLGALSQSAEERMDGRDLLRHYGLIGDQDNWGNFAGGLAAEIVADPFAILSGATKAYTTAGRAAAKAGLMHTAPQVLSKAYIAGKELSPELAARAEKGLASIGRTLDTVSQTDVAGRPLIGRRAASRYGTLQDLVDYADDPEKARQSVLDALSGTPEQRLSSYEKIKRSRLGGDIGVGLPLMDPSFSFSIPGGTAINDTLDAAGQMYRWSLPGRLLNAFSNNASGQALDAESQMLYQGADAASRAAKSEARRENAFRAAKLFQEEPDVFTEEGNRALGRLIEKPKSGDLPDVDNLWDSDHPAARAYREWWDERSKQLPQDFEQVGLRGATFDDPFISGYLPRKAGGMVERAAARDPSLGRILGTLTSDQMSRSKELQVPGGRDMIAFELSRDPNIAGAKRLARTDDEAAKVISESIYNKTGELVDQKQALYLAQLLHKLPDTVLKEAPLFGQHPVASIAQYIEGRAGAAATMHAVYDSLASVAQARPSQFVEGGNHISLAEALNRVGARSSGTEAAETGARMQMRQRLAERLGVDPDKVDLARISVPEDQVVRLARVRESYTSPQAAQEIGDLYDSYTRWWRNAILAWPSRITRDLYSGAYSNWLEGAFDLESVGMARKLAAKSAFDPDFMAFLKKMPKYSSVADEDLAAHFYADLHATGLLDGSYMADRKMTTAGGPIQDMLVGTNPETFRGALSELGGNWGGFFNTDTNPIIRAGARAGNLSDKINRMTGYLALLKKGVSPEEAARRMKRAHVDYSSLTPIERKIRDRILPFYAYTSRITGEVLRQILERPGGRYGQGLRAYERAQEGGDKYVPEYMRSQFAAPIDPDDPVFGWLGIPEQLGTRFFTDVDLPGYDQLQMFGNDGNTTLNNLFMQTNPLIRIPTELIRGQDYFTQQPINATTRSQGPIGKGIRAWTGDQSSGVGWGVSAADKILDATPFASRPARLAAQLYDQDAGLDFPTRAFGAAVNFSGAGKLRDVTPEAARQDAIRKLQKMATPYTRETTIRSIPRGMEASVPQNAQDALRLSRQMQRDARESRRHGKTQWHNPFE